jgi:hypothetical protein
MLPMPPPNLQQAATTGFVPQQQPYQGSQDNRQKTNDKRQARQARQKTSKTKDKQDKRQARQKTKGKKQKQRKGLCLG